LDLHFKDYLRFQPSGGIYVTIATNGWYVDAAACVGFSASPTNCPPAAAPVDNDEFPLWTENRPE